MGLMKIFLITLITIFVFTGCSTKQIYFKELPKTKLEKSDFSMLPNWKNEEFDNVLKLFIKNCTSSRSQKIYPNLCQKALHVKDSKKFFETNFTPYQIKSTNDESLLTGYYEPLIEGSLEKKAPFIYPIYKTPKDLITINLNSIYPELKKYRLRGKLEGNKLIPYNSREDISKDEIDADIICYTNSKIDLFFLEVQGSGRVKLRDGKIIFIGYDNQNGHRYKSIGKYLVNKGEIPLKNISLQSIKKWLEENPNRIDEVLNYNKSVVFFKERKKPATGALNIVLTQKRSVAVDRKYIPLGSMLYFDTKVDGKKFNKSVFAQDIGGAIKGEVRADLFVGYGNEAMQTAGKLKSALKIWIFLPKDLR